MFGYDSNFGWKNRFFSAGSDSIFFDDKVVNRIAFLLEHPLNREKHQKSHNSPPLPDKNELPTKNPLTPAVSVRSIGMHLFFSILPFCFLANQNLNFKFGSAQIYPKKIKQVEISPDFALTANPEAAPPHLLKNQYLQGNQHLYALRFQF